MVNHYIRLRGACKKKGSSVLCLTGLGRTRIVSFIYTLKGTARRATRLIAVQILYQIRQSHTTPAGALAQFEESYGAFCAEASATKDPNVLKRRNRRPRVDVPFLRQLVLGVLGSQDEIRKILAQHMQDGWTVDRLPLVLLYILELAVYELKNETAPAPIIINEAIELTKEFFEGEEPGFVNGLLDRVQKEQGRAGTFASSTESLKKEEAPCAEE